MLDSRPLAPLEDVRCSGEVLPPLLKGAMGVRQTNERPVGDGTILNSVDPDGQIKGIELYPECEYATAVHCVFDMDELVRYIRFSDLLAAEMRGESDQLPRC